MIWLLDDEDIFLRAAKRLLERAGFRNVKTFSEVRVLLSELGERQPDLMFVDIHLQLKDMNGISTVRAVRRAGYAGKLVMITGDAAPRLLFEAAVAGADDYLVKGPNLNFPEEVLRCLEPGQREIPEIKDAEELASLGYLRSSTLADREVELLAELGRGYPSIKELALRLNKREQSLRKDLSRIYRKLGLEHYGQLTNLVTILSFYLSRRER